MHRYFLISTLLFCVCGLYGQSYQIVQAPHDPDSSYYDVFKVSTNEYWAAGENGVLVKFDTNGIVRNIPYPSRGVDLLKIDAFNDNELIIVGKSGILYLFNRLNVEWEVIQVPGYENKAFYETAILGEKSIVIAGGMSKIADSKMTLPRGFIIRSDDKGKTWQKLYSNPLAMVWDIDLVNDTMFATIYNPLSRNRIMVSADGENWEKYKKIRGGLYHQFDERSGTLAGGEGISMNGNARLSKLDSLQQCNVETPFWWSSLKIGNRILSAGSDGVIMIMGNSNTILNTSFNIPFYEVVEVNERSAFLVGSHQTIIKVDLEKEELFTSGF